MEYETQRLSPEKLLLDGKNPRLAEFGITGKTKQEEILQVLWENMALEEIITSLAAHGFFDTEPLLAVNEGGKLIVIEGNRRLAAVKIVRDTSIVQNKLDPKVLERIDKKIIKKLEKVPVIVVANREEAWRFIGFKHINGPAKWNSFAKAQHIVQVHEQYGISLEEIAFQVGDTHKTVQKLFQGMMVIEEAEKLGVFHRDDIKKSRLYFSHLYTGLQYQGFKEYLDIKDASVETKTPVPENKKNNLRKILLWLYGSKKEDIEPVVRSQNPHLGQLEAVIKNPEARSALESGQTLEVAYELSRPKNSVFEESFYSAKRDLQKAWSFVNEGYNGSNDLLNAANSMSTLAQELYARMEEINKAKRNKKK